MKNGESWLRVCIMLGRNTKSEEDFVVNDSSIVKLTLTISLLGPIFL
jgi:hypothetical protein